MYMNWKSVDRFITYSDALVFVCFYEPEERLDPEMADDMTGR